MLSFWSAKEDASPAEATPLKRSKYGPQDLEGRRCTDVFCLLVFVLTLLIVLATSVLVFVRGDINDIRYGVDYMGHRCGNGTNAGRTKLWYPRIGLDVAEQSIVLSTRPWDIVLYGLCVSSCPVLNLSPSGAMKEIHDYGHGVDASAKATKWPVGISTVDMLNRCYPDPESATTHVDLCAQPTCTSIGAPCYVPGPASMIPAGTWEISSGHPERLCSAKLAIEQTVTREQANSGAYLDSVFSAVGTMKDVWESLVDNWQTIVIYGVGLTTVLNFLWIIILYLLAGVAVCACIWIVSLALTLSMLLSFVKAGVAADFISNLLNTTQVAAVMDGSAGNTINGIVSASDINDRWLWWTAAVLSSLLVLLWIIFVCCSRKAIDRCIVLIKQATVALSSSWGLAGLPWFIVTLQMAAILYCVLVLAVLTTFDANKTYTAHIQDLGDAYVNMVTSPADFAAANFTGEHPLFAGLTTSQEQWILGSIVGFGMVWLYAFLTTVGLMTIGACVFYFYYVNKETVPGSAYMKQFDDNQTRWPVTKHLGWVLRYHIGSMALGSFIIAVITVIQIVTKGFFEQLKRQSGNSGTLKVVAMCVNCCLACFKKTIEFVNSYAYVYIFLENVGFCTGANHTFQLMLKYPAQIAINTAVQRVLSLLQLLLVPGGVTLLAYISFNFADTSHTAYGGLLLTGTVLLCSLLMTRAFSGVFEQVIQSLTVCVMHDVDTFDGRFLRESMKEAFDDPKKAD